MKIITNLKQALKTPFETKFLKLKISEEIPRELTDLIYLEELYLEGNFTDFSLDLTSLTKLRLLSLQSSILKTFPTSTLNSLSLTNLKIIGGVFNHLTLPLEVISPLRSLTIKGTEIKSLPLEISQFEHLEEMNLSENKLSELPVSLMELKKLKRINIDKNEFEIFPPVIKTCVGLKYLSCDGNLFSEEEKARIQKEFNLTPH